MIGAGVIGSLYAGHLAEVSEVSVLTRRKDHADALNREGLRITGRSDRHATLVASADPDELPAFDLGIVATKADGLEDAAASLAGRFPEATIMANGELRLVLDPDDAGDTDRLVAAYLS